MIESLTDDEIIAWMAAAGKKWATSIRTVDLSSEEAIAAATFRGLRSLAVRGLSTHGSGVSGVLPGQLDALLVRASEAAAMHAMLMPNDNLGALAGSGVVALSDAVGVVVDVVQPNGVHVIEDVSAADALQRLVRLHMATFTNGVEGDSLFTSNFSLVTFSPFSPSTDYLRVQRGSVEYGSYEVDGSSMSLTARVNGVFDEGVVAKFLERQLLR